MKNFRKKILKLIVYAIGGFFVASIQLVLILTFVNPPITTFMIYQYAVGNHRVIVKEWQPIEKINPSLPLAAIASEDQDYLNHWGFDFEAISKAFEQNQNQKRIRGGSTISQQLSKNLFLIPTKSYLRKGFEGYFTVLIEFFWSKKRIMEVYLNVVEVGEGVYGASAAAKLYFGKNAEMLNNRNSSLIVTALPNPKKYNINHPSQYMLNRSAWVRRQMRNLGGKSIIAHWYE